MSEGPPASGGGSRDDLERRLAGLSPAKRALLARQSGRVAAAAVDSAIPRADHTAPAPLSFGQELLWLVEQATSGTGAYNVPSAHRIRGAFDVATFQKAIDALVARHEVFRTRFPVVDGAPVQIVEPQAHIGVTFADYGGQPNGARDARDWLRGIAKQSFDLPNEFPFRVAVARISPDEHWLLLSLHHLISDGWSRGVLYGDLSAFYNAFRAGRTPDLPALHVQYRDFAVWQRKRLQGDVLRRELEFWRGQLSEASEQITLPYDFSRPRAPSFEGNRVSIVIPMPVLEQLRALGRQHKASPFVTLLGAVHAFLHRYTGSRDVVVAVPVAGRPQPELAPLIGYFGNTLLLRAQLDDATTYRALIESGRERAMAAFEHQELPFERLTLDLPPERRMSNAPLFHAMFAFNTGTQANAGFDGLDVSSLGDALSVAKTDLLFSASEVPAGLQFGAEYRVDLFEKATIERMLSHFEAFLTDCVARPDAPVWQLEIMGADERKRIVHDWNATRTEYPREAFVHEVFISEAQRRPNAVAVECGSATLTYRELDQKSNAVAQRLIADGVAEGDRVGVFAERSLDAVIATIGILKAGAIFVPLEPTYPAERLDFMVSDSKVRLVLAQEHLIAKYPELPGVARPRIEVIDVPAAEISAPAPRASASNPGTRGAYVMYTSGSTGRPKGVVVPHRGIVRLVRNTNYTAYGEDTAMLGIAPSAFDAATLEYWPPLLNGGRLVFLPPGPLDLGAIADLVERRKITTMWLTAALFNQVVELGLEKYASARLIMTGGDVLSVPHIRRALDALPDCVLLNGYGPTENTVFTTCFPIPRDWPRDASLPIGAPVSNTSVYVLDPHGNPLPIGIAGEIYTGGDGLALGYLDRPEMTAERFVADPFAGDPGARMYRTGDYGRWGADGLVRFIGRTDTQVKVRGFRVEPGEVEAVLGAHPAVRQAAVIARKTPKGDTQLVGYYAVQTNDAVTAPPAMRAYLKERVPDHMVPAVLMRLDALPIGPTGKLNRAALPPPDAASGAEERGRMGARNNVEVQLLGIWEGLLEMRPIGVEQDFFELGGHSLHAVRMLAEVERALGRKIPLTVLFEHSTIAALAEFIENDVFSSEEPPVSILQGGGKARPFAFVHGDVHGGGWYCRRLAPMLGTDVPFIALPTLRPATASATASIEAMAARHVSELRRVQPRGPYRLGGFCAGGTIAFEMARQLVEAGERVDRVVLIDSSAANYGFRAARVLIDAIAGDAGDVQTVERRASVLRRLHYYRGRVRTVQRRDAGAQWRWVLDNVRRRLPLGGKNGVDDAPVPVTAYAAIPGVEEGPGMEVVRFQDLAAGAYIPRRFPGRIDLVFSVNTARGQVGPETPADANEPIVARQSRARWQNWRNVADDVRIHAVTSTHLELATRNLAALGATMRGILANDDR